MRGAEKGRFHFGRAAETAREPGRGLREGRRLWVVAPEERKQLRRSPQRLLGEQLRRFIDANRRLSGQLNRHCEMRFGRVDGSSRFAAHLDALLAPGLRVLDLGAGRHPSISRETKERLGLHVVGVDISKEELDAAPDGSYDEAIVSDVTALSRPGSADLVLSRALTEHLRETEAMWERIHEALAPGGKTLHFIPNGKAFFARLNRALPHELKRKILFSIYPEAETHLGFEAFYDRCSPSETRDLLRRRGFRDVRIHPYYSSNYFAFFLPAHLAAVGAQLAFQTGGFEDACQSFVVEATKG